MSAERYTITVPPGRVHVPGRVEPEAAARAATATALTEGAADGPWAAGAETALADVLRADVP